MLETSNPEKIVDDPSIIPAVVEELLRRHGIVTLARVLKKDYNHNGILMKAGDLILLPTALAGLDETAFPDPFEIDLEARDARSLRARRPSLPRF